MRERERERERENVFKERTLDAARDLTYLCIIYIYNTYFKQ